MNDFEVYKIRRLSLTLSLILFVFSVAGIDIDLEKNLYLFGLPAKIANPGLIQIGLVIGSLYATVRYFYYAIIIGITPKKARKNLLSNKLSDGNIVGTEHSKTEPRMNMETIRNIIYMEVEKYFPSNNKNKVSVRAKDERYFFEIVVDKRAQFLGKIHSLDYWLPIWACIISIIVYVYTIIK